VAVRQLAVGSDVAGREKLEAGRREQLAVGSDVAGRRK